MYITFIAYYMYKYYIIKYLWQTQDCEKVIKPTYVFIIDIWNTCTMKIEKKNPGDG